MKLKKTDLILAVLSGGATAAAAPKFGLSFFAWISLIPLFFIIINKKPAQSFLLGLIAGISYNSILIYWIPSVPAHYGNLSLGISIVIYVVFVLFLALYWAFSCLVITKISQSFSRLVFFLIPFIWVALEYILTHFLTGFPWGLVGSSQHSNIWFIQLATITGVYGLSFILILFQSMFVYSMRHNRKMPFLAALALVLIIHLGGWLSLKKITPDENSFSAAVIQGNVSSDIYWDRISTLEIWDLFDRHLELSQKANEGGADLIIWPEFSVPLCFSCSYGYYQDFKEKLFQFVQEKECTLLIGTNEQAGSPGSVNYFNTALCLSPNLSQSQYHKMHLVPFGEYTPYKKIFGFIESMTHAIGEITPGTEYNLHQFKELKFGSPICYEIIFPDLVRRFVKKGAHFLTTITNDGWYGKSSAPYQHFSMAVLRAVENRRFLLRAATTGISGIIDPYGRVLSESQLMTQTHLFGIISPSEKLTFYTRFGDVLPFLSLTLSAAFLILSLVKSIYGRKRIST